MKHLALTHPAAYGGPGTFQKHLVEVLPKYGWAALPPGELKGADALLVVIGTRNLKLLWQAKRRGIPILHRLDGVLWEHKCREFTIKQKLMFEARSLLMRYIRANCASEVVYQSNFIRDSWHQFYGPAVAKETVIYNGTNTDRFYPLKRQAIKREGLSMLIVEGFLKYNQHIHNILKSISDRFVKTDIIQEIKIVGRVRAHDKANLNSISGVTLLGAVERERMPEVYRLSDFFFCLEVNPPCPNAVLEAMASGLPIAGFDTGALSELVGSKAGALLPYGGNPWLFEPPNVANAAQAVSCVIDGMKSMSAEARSRADKKFNINMMAKNYIESLERLLL